MYDDDEIKDILISKQMSSQSNNQCNKWHSNFSHLILEYDDAGILNSSLGSNKYSKALDGDDYPPVGASSETSYSRKRQKKVVINYADHHRMSITGNKLELDNLDGTPIVTTSDE